MIYGQHGEKWRRAAGVSFLRTKSCSRKHVTSNRRHSRMMRSSTCSRSCRIYTISSLELHTVVIIGSTYRPRVSFTSPVIQSICRRPTRLEYLYLNLFENHVQKCSRCIPILDGYIPYRCAQGQALEYFVVLSFWVARDGSVRSAQENCGYSVHVELPRTYKATAALLWQERWWHTKYRR